MTDLGPTPDARDMELLRDGPGVDPAAKARVRSRLAAVIPSMAVGGAVASAGASVPRVSGAVTRTGAYVAALATFVVGGVVGALLYADLAAPRGTRIVFVDRPVSVPIENAAPSRQPEAPKPAPVPVAVAPDVSASTASPQRAGPSQLSAERRILDEARGALLRGEAQQSLAALERHRRTFAAPMLGEERDALQVQALVKADRLAEARTHAEAFRRRFPDSFYLPMVDSAVGW